MFLMTVVACSTTVTDPPFFPNDNDAVASIIDGRGIMAGGFRLENPKRTFELTGPEWAGMYRGWGGQPGRMMPPQPPYALEPDGLFGELFFSWNLQAFRPDGAEIVSSRDPDGAHVQYTGKTIPMAFARAALGQDPAPTPLDVTYDYTLANGDDVLQLQVTLSNPGPEDIVVDRPWIWVHPRKTLRQFVPGPGLGEIPAGQPMPYIGLVGPRAAYGLFATTDDLTMFREVQGLKVVAQPAFVIPAGGEVVREYRFAVSNQNATALDRIHDRLFGAPQPELSGVVEYPKTMDPASAWVAARQNGEVVSLSSVNEDHGFSFSLPAGDYELTAYALGRTYRWPVPVTLTEEGTTDVRLAIPAASPVLVTTHTHARVTFYRTGDMRSPWAPEDVRFDNAWPDPISAVVFPHDGIANFFLPRGHYRAVASAGPAYELATMELDVAGTERTVFDFELTQVVDTTGWLSSDFDVHGSGSAESRVPLGFRSAQGTGDHLAIGILTDNEVIDGFGSGPRNRGPQPMRGQELATFEFGRFAVFPLGLGITAPAPGPIYPFGTTPSGLFDRILDHGETDRLIQVNHPRGDPTEGYFDYVGLDTSGTTPTVARPEAWRDDFDIIEGVVGCEKTPAFDDWVALMNMGVPKTLGGGSNAHRVTHAAGMPTVWTRMSWTDGFISAVDFITAVRARRSFISCGPFLRFAAADGTGIGGRTKADASGTATFTVAIEAPSWVTLTEARLLENGTVIQTWDLSGATGTSRLDTTATVKPAGDAWYILEVVGTGDLLPISDQTPYAVTNPIEVDADGDGVWTAPRLQ